MGNVCVNRFLGINTGKIISGLKKITENNCANTNIELILYAKESGCLRNEREFQFLLDINKKRKLTEKQKQWKNDINRLITNGLVVRSSK